MAKKLARDPERSNAEEDKSTEHAGRQWLRSLPSILSGLAVVIRAVTGLVKAILTPPGT